MALFVHAYIDWRGVISGQERKRMQTDKYINNARLTHTKNERARLTERRIFSILNDCSAMESTKRATHLVAMRYWARLMASAVPLMSTVRSLVPSSLLLILMVAPDSCLLWIQMVG